MHFWRTWDYDGGSSSSKAQLILGHFGDFVCAEEVGESWSSLAKADWRKLVFADKMIQRMTLSDYGVQNGGSMNVNR